MSRMYPTKNDLLEPTRKGMIELLNRRLAEGIDLSLQAKQAHWNVKGPAFFALHELFDKVYLAAVEWVDLIAERAVQLGGVADGALPGLAGRSKLPPYPPEVASGADHVAALARTLAAFGTAVRAAIDAAANAPDADTADLLTEVSRGADKMLWLVEAHAHAER